MCRLVKVFLFVALVAFMPVTVKADFYCQGIWYVEVSDSTVITRPGEYSNNYQGNNVEGDVVIPKSVKNYFEDKSYKVVGIGKNSFYNCSGMTGISIPETVSEIGALAFSGCGFSEVDIPESVVEIGNQTFENCKNLFEVSLPKSLKSIPDNMFGGCERLKSIDIPGSVISIGSNAFNNSGIETVVVPNSVTQMGKAVFANCKNLQNVILPDKISEISSEMFYKCAGLKNIDIPASVTAINESAFSDCESLSEVVIPDAVYKIDYDAFFCCSALESITIPGTVTFIGQGAFYGSGIRSVEIPSNISFIGRNAFYNENLTVVTYLTPEPVAADYDYFSSYTYSYGTLNYLEGYKDVYQNIRPWYYFRNLEHVSSVGQLEDESSEDGLRDVYNMSGTCLIRNATSSDINELPSGIYIIGGEKVRK